MSRGPMSKEGEGKRGPGFFLFLGVFLLIVGLCLIYYWGSLTGLNRDLTQARGAGPVRLRALPYPYRAAVGLTVIPRPGQSQKEFYDCLRYLNTVQATPYGRGLGLEAGASFFFYPPSEEWLAYFNPPGPEGESVRAVFHSLVRSGIVDVLDSYGLDPDFSREDAHKALTALTEQGLILHTWADRQESPSNLSLEGGRGAYPGRMVYHADLTFSAGFCYYWLGQSTPLVGQNVPVTWKSFAALYHRDRPLRSSFTTVWALLRHFLRVLTSSEEDALRRNRLTGPITFKDGTRALEFLRYRPVNGASSLSEAFEGETLARLAESGGVMIVAGRLCAAPDERPLPPEAQETLADLADRYRRGHLLVTTATRLLTLDLATQYLQWRVDQKGDEVHIHLVALDDPATGPRPPRLVELAGLTFYVPQSDKARIYLQGRELDVRRHLIDHTGRESVSLPWPRLRLPDIVWD